MRIETTHLRLLPYSPEHLLALIDTEAHFADCFGHRAADGLREFIVSDEVSPEWVAQLRESASADPWVHGFAVVHQYSQLVIGSVGFKGPPHDQGSVEIGYGIVPPFQGRGYATEAAKAAVAFAFQNDRVRTVLAHTLPASNASTRVLQKCGFAFTSEVVDPEDGVVWRWERHREG